VQIVSGNAAMSKNGGLAQSSASVGSIPEIHSFAVHEESRLRITTDQGVVTSRIVTVPAGGIESIKTYFGETAVGMVAPRSDSITP
jgi:hypothetical protein